MRIQHKLLIGLLAILTWSCQMNPCGSGPEDLIIKMESVVQKSKDLKSSSSDKQWEKLDSQFAQLFEDCYPIWEETLSGKQKGKFVALSFNYLAIRLSKNILDIFDINDKKEDPWREKLKEIQKKLKEDF